MNQNQQLRSNLIALGTLVLKETHRYMRIWAQTLLPPAITMTLYFVIFGSLIGPRIGPMDGYSYIEFIAPGIIMMAVITNSYANVASSFFGAKFQSHIEEILVSPTPNFFILLGYLAGGVGRGLLVGLIVTLVALFFTDLRIHNPWITLSVVLLTAILFSLGGFLNALFGRKFDDIAIVPTFVLTPLTYLGGVFYSISLLPPFWERVSHLNPILYMVNGFRYGILGASDIDIRVAYSIILLFIVLLGGFCLYLLNRGTGLRK
ncbi:ABC transporter permease [Alkalilimnicola sp. S0819]|uniref:ABC transporter permease n=1 Tax=Alkalilimnicola sp. S0819 TaxID=2613922 RepID=UPI001262147B|nr:ABC transporter permease [Alkalilimnicola sp. S0819]KAB7628412.1 ABC transporter permease [Alkalilimnicola sp. S0819]MPQ15315.1 ABC transporter permease [Alkalilimnicola sp. S0819]